MERDEDRVAAHPRNVVVAHQTAAKLGIAVQISDLCPPGIIYIMRPPPLSWDDPDFVQEWVNSLGRIDGLAD